MARRTALRTQVAAATLSERMGNPDLCTSSWLFGIAGAAGAALALGNLSSTKAPARRALVLLAPAVVIVVLGVGRSELFFTAFGAAFVVHGLLGMATGRIGVAGKGGAARTYSGGAAVLWGLTFIAVGLGAFAFGAGHELWLCVFGDGPRL